MPSGKKIASIAFTGAAAAGVAGFAAAPALAGVNTWTITRGGVAGNGSVKGHNSTVAQLSVKPIIGNAVHLKCPISTARTVGSVSGNGKANTLPTQLGKITKSTTFGTSKSPCTLSGTNIKVTATEVNYPLAIVASTHTSPRNLTTGVTKGFVGKGATSSTKSILAKVKGVPGTTCSMSVSGTKVSAELFNSVGVFAVNPGHHLTLHTKNVNCGGLIPNNASAAFFASYSTSPVLAASG